MDEGAEADPEKEGKAQYGEIKLTHAHTVPLGLTDLSGERLVPWQGNLAQAALYIATDGVTEAISEGDELGVDGFADLVRQDQGLNAAQRLASIMRRFMAGKLKTHDDTSLMVVTGADRMEAT